MGPDPDDEDEPPPELADPSGEDDLARDDDDAPDEGEGEEALRLRLLLELIGRARRRRRPPAPPPFPPATSADAAGLVAWGGRLDPDLVLDAYRRGIFPMADPSGEIGWWSPEPRVVIDFLAPGGFHVPRRLARTVRQGRFELRLDAACAEVIAACADRDETWIDDRVAACYLELHRRGVVHTVEAWQDGRLAGGLYGVALGGAFFAESMFHRVTDASKVAVVGLVERLRARGYALLDIQMVTGATAIFRPRALRRRDYLERLAGALGLACSFVDPT